MVEKMNLYQKIAEVMKDVQYLCKDDSIEFGKTKYKAISEEKVTSTVRESLIKHGIVIIPVEQEHSREGTLSTVDVKYRIQNIEDKNDCIIAVSSGTGVDTQDKGVGKAMTYAYKYLLLRTFAIPTGEDPDKISSAELDDKQKEEKKSTINKSQIMVLEGLIKKTDTDTAKFLEYYKVDKPEKLTNEQYDNALIVLKKKNASA